MKRVLYLFTIIILIISFSFAKKDRKEKTKRSKKSSIEFLDKYTLEEIEKLKDSFYAGDEKAEEILINIYGDSKQSLPIRIAALDALSESKNTIQSAYNYPNPITKGYTTFRFYIENQNKVDINIYDIHGLKIKDFHITGLNQNEYNEIKWNNIKNLSPGLYYAEVIFDNRESELIKLAVIQ